MICTYLYKYTDECMMYAFTLHILWHRKLQVVGGLFNFTRMYTLQCQTLSWELTEVVRCVVFGGSIPQARPTLPYNVPLPRPCMDQRPGIIIRFK